MPNESVWLPDKPPPRYSVRLAKQVWIECTAWSYDQIMPIVIAFIGAALTVYLHLVPLSQSHALYEVAISAFLIALPIYLVGQIARAPYILDMECQQKEARLSSVLQDAQERLREIDADREPEIVFDRVDVVPIKHGDGKLYDYTHLWFCNRPAGREARDVAGRITFWNGASIQMFG
jgi:PAS domain-containing protein